MKVNVEAELSRLAGTRLPQLKNEYDRLFGETTRCNNRQYLIKRIIWRLQAQAEGDLSERARRRAEELANDADLRIRAPSTPPTAANAVVVPVRYRPAPQRPVPGSLLVRDYKGTRIFVRVLERGFEYEGRVYRSLTAIAQAVTGSHWNGQAFFGVTQTRNKEPHR